MYYVEFLRVFRALRNYAIVIAVGFAIMAAFRIGIGPTLHREFMKNFSPTAVRTVTNANGVETVTIVDPAKETKVVQHTGPDGWDMTIIESANRHRHHTVRNHGRNSSGGFGLQINEYDAPDGTHVSTIRNDRRLPFGLLALLTSFLGAIFATVIGASLSRENDGHLEIVWTKPVSREGAAMTMMAVDLAGIVAAMLLSGIAFYFTTAVYVGWPVLTFEATAGIQLLVAILFPVAWYALAQGLSASLGRTGRMLAGITWVAAIVCLALLGIQNSVLHNTLLTANVVNPLAYYVSYALHMHGAESSFTLLPSSVTVDILALAAITIVAITASLVQWRRLEA